MGIPNALVPEGIIGPFILNNYEYFLKIKIYPRLNYTPPGPLEKVHDEQPELWREQWKRCIVRRCCTCCIVACTTCPPKPIFNHQHSKHCFLHVAVVKLVRAVLPSKRCTAHELDCRLAGWQCVFPRQLGRRCR